MRNDLYPSKSWRSSKPTPAARSLRPKVYFRSGTLGVNKDGRKDILGMYLSENEGAHFWLSVLNDLRARGIEDILIASIDGLKGFPDAIAQVFPKAEIPLCVVHQIRNSLKYVVSKDQKIFTLDLKLIYKASSKDLAEHHLLELGEKWGKKYPAVILAI